jgi:small subunit ribosomal protein S4
MGDPKRRRKSYSTPGHPYEQARLESELAIVGKFGLRNKRELWKARTQLGAYRQQARYLLALELEERDRLGSVLTNKLTRLGILKENASIDDVLALEVEDILRRRLQTRVYEIGLASSVHHARQLIVHRHIVFDDHVLNVPSYIVSPIEEEKIKYRANSPFNDPSHSIVIKMKSQAESPDSSEESKKPTTKGRGRR